MDREAPGPSMGNNRTRYVAVRRGKSIRRCIFLDWQDCIHEIKGFDEAEYSTFLVLEEAVQYLREDALCDSTKKVDDTAFPTNIDGEQARSPGWPGKTATLNSSNSPPDVSVVGLAAEVLVGDRNHAPSTSFFEGQMSPALDEQENNSIVWPGSQQGATVGLKASSRSLTPIIGDNSFATNRPLQLGVPALQLGVPAGAVTSPSVAKPEIQKAQRGRSTGATIECELERQSRISLQSKQLSIQSTEGDILEPLSRMPSPLWWEYFLLLTQYKKQHQSLVMTTSNLKVLLRGKNALQRQTIQTLRDWCNSQRNSFKNLSQSQMEASVKVARLQSIGFDFQSFDLVEEDTQGEDDVAEELLVLQQAQRLPDSTQHLGALDAKWEKFFDQLMAHKEQHGSLDVPATTPEGARLRKWMDSQRVAAKSYDANTASKRKGGMTQTKIDRLAGIGFVFEGAAKKPSKKWEQMLDKLTQFVSKTGSLEVGMDDDNEGESDAAKEKKVLKNWLAEQRAQYRCLRDGNKSTMTEEKVRRLKGIGYEFGYVPFCVRIGQLKVFIRENGTRKIPSDHELSKWYRGVRAQMKRMESGDKKGSRLTQDQYNQLNELGILGGALKDPVETEEEARDWEENFAKLQRFKEDNGHCRVGPTPPWDSLGKWVQAQRRYFGKLEEGKPSKLTVIRMKRLMELGFVFRQKPKYKNFDERLEELRQFKEENGTTRVPTSQLGGLGSFVSSCRSEYVKYSEGRQSSLNERKVHALEALGFEFQVGQKKTLQFPTKTWEERFQQLLSYKEENGHTVVPQQYTGFDNLGKWVHSQRKNYKKMKRGVPSPLTAEKALRLNEIGFVWDATYKIRRRHDGNSDEEEGGRRQAKKPRRQRDAYESMSDEEEAPRRFWY